MLPINCYSFADKLSGALHSHGTNGSSEHSHSHGGSQTYAAVASRDSDVATVAASGEPAPANGSSRVIAAATGPPNEARSISAMTGLVVHAAVDGVALGAAVAEGDSGLGMIVFFAIMLHKAPSSFGLASYLLHSGLTTAGVQTRLFIFSCAAPLGAIFTYSLLATQWFTYTQETLSMLLLFSGGTFLYVATAHILPEIQHQSAPGRQDDDDDGHSSSEKKLNWREVGFLVAGVLLPLLLNIGHGH